MLGPAPARAETVNCTPVTSVPFSIVSSGVYCLTGNLDHAASGPAITVLTGNVVLDLNGFRLRSTSATSLAAGVLVRRGRVTVRNGIIQEFTPAVSVAPLADEVVTVILIEHIVADRSRGAGIVVDGRHGTVQHNRVVLTGRRITSQEDDPTFRGIRVVGRGHRVLDNDVLDMRIAPSDSLAIQVNAADTVVEGNRIAFEDQRSTNSGEAIGIQVDGVDATDVLVVGNRITTASRGVLYAAGATGKLRDNLTSNVAAPYTGGTDAGNNQ
jgi:hypothetical protein